MRAHHGHNRFRARALLRTFSNLSTLAARRFAASSKSTFPVRLGRGTIGLSLYSSFNSRNKSRLKLCFSLVIPLSVYSTFRSSDVFSRYLSEHCEGNSSQMVKRKRVGSSGSDDRTLNRDPFSRHWVISRLHARLRHFKRAIFAILRDSTCRATGEIAEARASARAHHQAVALRQSEARFRAEHDLLVAAQHAGMRRTAVRAAEKPLLAGL